MAKGTLYGIGVGPGDPELLTIKGKRTVEACDVIAYPVKNPGETSVALEIIRPETNLEGKEILELWFKMDPSNEVRQNYRNEAIKMITDRLDAGKNVCMVTLGDVGVFSTYMRINDDVEALGYDTAIVPGIPSFCGGAAKAKVPLVIGEEGLAIVPNATENTVVGKAMDDFENIVVMKAFKSMPELLDMMEARGIPAENGKVISNIGMEDEYVGPMVRDKDYGYFTTVIIKKNGL